MSFSAQNPLPGNQIPPSPELTTLDPGSSQAFACGVPLAWKALCRVPAHVTHWLCKALCEPHSSVRTALTMSGSLAGRPHMATFISSENQVTSEARKQPRWCRRKGCRRLPWRAGSWGGQPRLLMGAQDPRLLMAPGLLPMWLSLAHWEHRVGVGGEARVRKPILFLLQTGSLPPRGVPGSVCDLSPGSPFLPSKPGEMAWSTAGPLI